MRGPQFREARALLLIAALLTAGCAPAACITIPASDAVPPVTGASVFFRGATGTGVEKAVNTTDRNSPLTVTVPPRTNFTIFYSGTDKGGVKTLALYESHVGWLRSDFSGDKCVRDARINRKDYQWQGQASYHEFNAAVGDFAGNSSVTPKLTVHHGPPPPDWPLGDGPYRAGFVVVQNVPGSLPMAGRTFNSAIVFYPAVADGENTSFGGLGAFSAPLIVFGHAHRASALLCPGSPADRTQDFRQLNGILAHLARWGFVSIAPDLSWAHDPSMQETLLHDAVTYMLLENGTLLSKFWNRIAPGGVGAMGHSTGGLAAIYLGTGRRFSGQVRTLGLIAPAAFNLTDEQKIASFAPRPVLVLHGTKEPTQPGTMGVDDKPLDIYREAQRSKHLVKIGGANHFGYTDEICLEPPQDGVATISRAEQQATAKAYLTAFFRRYLGGVTGVDDYLTGARVMETLEALDITVQAVP